MRIAWVVAGTRGDVQPAAVAAAALQRRGHEVALAAPDDLVRFGTALGVRSTPLGVDVGEFLRSEEGAAWLAAGDLQRYLAGLLAHKQRHLAALTDSLLRTTEGADLIVGGGLLREEAAALAELRGASLVFTGYAPRFPNRAYPPIGLPQRPLPGALITAAHRLVVRRTARVGAPFAADFRRGLGLPAHASAAAGRVVEPQLYSRHLVPRLPDRPARPLLGFVRPTTAQHAAWGEPGIDPALEAWLADGPPPVWFGFGSMPLPRLRSVLDVVQRAAERLGVRALVGVGRQGADRPGATDDRVRVVGEIDHGAVLPACAAAVHHGGAGTTAASVGAGLPTLVFAVAFDQPFWGRRLAELGIGSGLPFAAFEEDALVDALRPLLDPRTAARARAVAALLREDRPLDRLAELVEGLPAPRPRRTTT
ncbi:glycosyltransferase [Amnibacterium setariae]|uniref:Glycosyltransferase n=1 Tax=Amnibacterium setariae TaxID=2306585 RepID=A0A3A1U299_9MICO|nr:glycosyltransferase [Amnibacterium setariae]RIX28586.1 glycosyltransferase [Amnibacterium setariae]